MEFAARANTGRSARDVDRDVAMGFTISKPFLEFYSQDHIIRLLENCGFHRAESAARPAASRRKVGGSLLPLLIRAYPSAIAFHRFRSVKELKIKSKCFSEIGDCMIYRAECAAMKSRRGLRGLP